MQIASVVKARSNCIRMEVGAVIVKDRRIIATGYNGTPYGIPNCSDGGCKRCLDREKNRILPGKDKEKCVCIHAEQNAIIQSAYHGTSTKDSVMYSTIEPCISCSKMIANAGIKRVFFKGTHYDGEGMKLLKKAGVRVDS